MNKVRIADLPKDEFRSPSGKFCSTFQNLSLALGGKRDVGPWGGGHPFDVQLRRVPPGAAVCPQHAHTTQWEFFIVLSGSATVQADAESHPVEAGEAFVQLPGVAHQIVNTGKEDLVFYVIADNPPADTIYYPKSKKWFVKPQRKLFRMTEVDYFEGEE